MPHHAVVGLLRTASDLCVERHTLCQCPVIPGIGFREAADDDLALIIAFPDGLHGNPCSLCLGVTVYSRADTGEGNAPDAFLPCNAE